MAARAARWDDARSQWAQATALAPLSATARAKLGIALWNLGRKDEAAAAWNEALTLDEHARAAIEGLTRIDLENADAGAALTRLSRLSDPSPVLYAAALLARGSNDDAKAALEAVQRAAPNDPEAHYLLGSAQIALHQFREAQATLEELGTIQPKSPLSAYGLARLAAAQNKQADALFHLSIAKKVARTHWDARRVASDPAFQFLSGLPEFHALVSK